VLPLAAAALVASSLGAATAGASGCATEGAAVARAVVTGTLEGDGQATEVARRLVVESEDGRSCTTSEISDGDQLPVAVAVLHSTQEDGSLEVEELGDARGPVSSRVAVRDRTAVPRTLDVDAPHGRERIERRVAVP